VPPDVLQNLPRVPVLGRKAAGAKAEAEAKHARRAETRYISLVTAVQRCGNGRCDAFRVRGMFVGIDFFVP